MPQDPITAVVPSSFGADSVYGPTMTRQASSSTVLEHSPGEPEPTTRTKPAAKASGPLANPVLMLVGLVALAVLLLNVSITGSVEVSG